MPTKEYALTMARYNLWQNQSLMAAADGLSAAEREQDRGAFFCSIEKTLSHVFWGDMLWMSRFAGTPPPDGSGQESVYFIRSWQQYRVDRRAFDDQILNWTHQIAPDWFEGDLTWYAGSVGRELTQPRKTLVIQFFNHQTHHRGQVHAMLTAAGAKPEDTDLPLMPDHIRRM